MGALTSVEICAGAGGQAIGLEQAGFEHEAVVEIDRDACETLRLNRGSDWKVIEGDVADVDGRSFGRPDLFAGGVPCPPFSIAGKQLGSDDERDLFPQALRLIAECDPRAVLLENVRGLAAPRFDAYRASVQTRLHQLGYRTWWDLVHASEHGVPQLRPRFVLVGIREAVGRGVPLAGARPRPGTDGGGGTGRPHGRARLARGGRLGPPGGRDRADDRRRPPDARRAGPGPDQGAGRVARTGR